MPTIILFLVAILLLSAFGLVVWFYLIEKRRSQSIRNLMSNAGAQGGGIQGTLRKKIDEDQTGDVIERIKSETKKNAASGQKQITLEDKFFQAGMFTEAQKRDFRRLQVICPIVGFVVVGGSLFVLLPSMPLVYLFGFVIGTLGGFQAPISILDRRIQARAEEIMYYLPLVIEQISIGVSSSLDVGPCLQRVVSMADERDSHNVVTELVRHVQFYIRSGVSMEDALVEVGKSSGHTELKHAFMSLSQVAKHGGDISSQLQELADAVSKQREARIEEQIKKLEVKASGPVAMVFAGFMIALVGGLFLRIMEVF
jgi:Flp pilus assembly protein TadB